MLKFFKSRTLWTLVFMFVFNGFASIQDQLPALGVMMVNAAFTLLAGYFKLSPSQKYE